MWIDEYGTQVNEDGTKQKVKTGKRPSLIKSDEVDRWMKGIKESLLEQHAAQGSPSLSKKLPLCLWVDIVVPSKSPIPNKDADNVYTTLQETLQKPTKPGGIIGLVEEDNQCVAYSVWARTQPRLIQEYAMVYAWEMAKPYIWPLELAIFLTTYYIPKVMQGEGYEESFKDTKQLQDFWGGVEAMLNNR